MTEARYFLRGEIDIITAPSLQADLRTLIDTGHDDIAVDCCGLCFIDSTGVAVLLAAVRELEASGRSFRILNADHLAEGVLEMMGLSDILHVNKGPSSALPLAMKVATAGGGEPACWAHLVCPECGMLMTDDAHDGCRAGAAD